MRTKFAAFAALVGMIVGTGSVPAHHSFAAEVRCEQGPSP